MTFTCAVVVTQLKPTHDSNLFRYLNLSGANKVVIVINDENSIKHFENNDIFTYMFTGENLGGAGGFSQGLQYALETFQPEWIWTSDDDAFPEENHIVKTLIDEANRHRLDVCSPIIVNPKNPSQLSFPYRTGIFRTWSRSKIEHQKIIFNQAHLFNGTLFNARIFSEIGFPEKRMFIRGDEVEFLMRVKKFGIRLGTYTGAVMVHPSGAEELRNALGRVLKICIPNSKIKFTYQIRNRGFIVRKYKKIHWLAVDLVRFVSFSLFRYRPRLSILYFLLKTYATGFSGNIESLPMMQDKIWNEIIGKEKDDK
jgi:rhamnopyranosyl-N-acetylglucosaminyl-diphospho-decaprenol beta-1,3/1,4-galactofuranosyltransferase